jgi:crotonobetainyl-CoA:carnitine CoA-transferase CaiB-like acyl-CoA transferase
LFSAYDVPCAPAEPRERFVDHPQVRHNQMFVDVDDPVLGKTTQMGLPVKFRGTPGAVGPPAPGIGENTGEVLVRLGYTEHQIAAMSDQGVVRLG